MDPSLFGVAPGTTNQVDPSSTLMPAGATGITLGTGTGQHGVSPTLATIGGGMGQALENVWSWLNKPFTQAMSPTDVFLLVGIVIVAVILWNLILYHIRIAAETI